KSSVLCNYRTTGGEIAGAALAEPAASEANVLIFGNRELTARGLDIVSIRPRVCRENVCIGQAPPIIVKQSALIPGHAHRGDWSVQWGFTSRGICQSHS